jgi:Flp pilus assembly protein TadD
MIPVPRFDKARRPLALLLCFALAACADLTLPPQASGSYPLFADAAFGPPSERMSAAEVFEVSPEMRAYMDTRVAELADRRGEARGLVESLFVDRRVKVDYDAGFTRTAAQAFAAHAGNCLSLAIVTGTMAKALGLDVRYQAVETSEHWERDGDLLELVGHVNVTVGPHVPKMQVWSADRDRWTVDFMADRDLRKLDTEPITEARVAAMFMNNRAAESLARGRVDDAYWWVRRGVEADPSFTGLYNTLGVTYLRKGMLHEAEAALRFAVAKSPRSPETWNNLALVLRRDGQVALAERVAREHPPTTAATVVAAVEEGKRANAAGDFGRALKLFKGALRTSADNHQLHYLLAVTYLNLGERDNAAQELRQAVTDSVTARQRSIYTSKAELLRSTAGGLRLDPNAAQSN